jgi:hypothetical protein
VEHFQHSTQDTMTRIRLLVAALGGALFGIAMQTAVFADEPLPSTAPTLQPFVIDHQHRTDAVDMRFLLDRTAGMHGFVRVTDGHLVTSDGRRFRCWGVNLAGWTPGSALLPPHTSSETYAASLARLGINCVRFQFLDLPDAKRRPPGEEDGEQPELYLPSGLIDSRRNDTRSFNPEQLDRLDYLVFQLKSHGIYIDFNLNVGRVYKEGDGVPDFHLIGNAKALTYFGPEIIAREKEYARDLLTHINPYTKTAYANEPAVALVEIVNENSLLEFWMRNWLRGEHREGEPPIQLDLTPHYRKLLTAQYNAWLTANRAADLTKLRKLAGVGTGEPIPLMRRGEFVAAPSLRFRAEIAFLTHIETDFMDDMRRYLQKTVGVKMPIIGSNDHTFFISGLPHLRTNARFDLQDAHAYWQHPAIYGRRGTPMVDEPAQSMIVKLARTAMLGKPFTVSEVNEPFPNDYGGEMVPILASYAAFQDWDAVFLYCLEPKLNNEWQATIGDYFDIAQDPVKIAELPLGATIFLRHDVATAHQVVARSYSSAEIDESARAPVATKPYFTPGFPHMLPLVHGSRIRCLDCQPMGKLPIPVGSDIVSDTGELSWHADGPHSGLLSIVSPKTEALTGFVKTTVGRRCAGTTPHLAADIANDFVTLGLTSLDGKPIGTADRLLLVATAKSANSGAVWDARHAMLKTWGGAPTLIEPVTGWIMLKELTGAVRVVATPLDGAGRPLAATEARMLEDGWEFPVGTPAATSYVITVTR